MNNIPFLSQNASYQRCIYECLLSNDVPIYHAKIFSNWISLNDQTVLKISSEYFKANGFQIDEKTLSQLIASTIDLERRLPVRTRLKFVLKVIVHSLFLAAFFLRSKSRLGTNSIRAYVENVETYFQGRKEITSVLVFPFPLGILRQLRYIFGKSQNGLRRYPAGQIYSFSDVLRVIISGNINDICFAERRASVRLAYFLRALGIVNLYMSEEYNPTMFVHNKVFRRLGGRSENVAHGVGMSIPFSYFDKAKWMTESQRVRYSSIKVYNNVSVAERSRIELFELLAKYSSVVFYGQRTITASSVVDAHEDNVIQIINSRGVNVVYKPHPRQKWNITIPKNCTRFDDTAVYENCLHISGYSTAIYERDMVDCCFVSSNKVRTNWLFEYDNVEIYNIDLK